MSKGFVLGWGWFFSSVLVFVVIYLSMIGARRGTKTPSLSADRCSIPTQYGDTMKCVCGLQWDTNDAYPPACLIPTEKP